MSINEKTNKKPVAIITGGGTGLGLAAGRKLSSLGYRVVAVGLDNEEINDSDDIEFVKLDVMDVEGLKKLALREPEVDVLINSAGIILHEGKEHSIEGFEQVVNINLNGTNRVCYEFKKSLSVNKGNIINIASMWSYFGSPNNPGYSASKGGVVALTRSLAASFASNGVRVNAIAPGWIKTRLSHHALNDPVRGTALMARLPMKEWGEPEDIADAVVFLSSSKAKYITGVLLPVDGGFSIG